MAVQSAPAVGVRGVPVALEERWRVLGAMLEGVPDPLLLLDREGRVLDARGQLPQDAHHAVGREVTELVEPESRADLTASIRDAVDPGVVGLLDVRMPSRGPCSTFQATVSPVRVDGEIQAVLLRMADVTHRVRDAERLRESEHLLRETQATAHLGYWEWEPYQQRVWWSPELYRIYGEDPRSFVPTYEQYLEHVHPADRARVAAEVDGVLTQHRPFSHDVRIYRADGALRSLHTWGYAVLGHDGRITRMIGVCQDVTDRKEAEARLMQALAERERLLREVRHRVKNNLQVIASLLNLQMGASSDRGLRKELQEALNRILAMGFLQEATYRADAGIVVDIRDYLHKLASNLRTAYGLSAERVKLQLAVEEVPLDADVATTCGLLVNELLSNAFLHAFPDGRGGTVTVTFHCLRDSQMMLAVRDDGVGIPPSVDLENAGTLGMQLISGLVQQLDGTLVHHGPPGTELKVTFKGPSPCRPEPEL